MIRVARTNKPAILDTNEAVWKKGIREAGDTKSRERAQSNYRKRPIKNALVAMFHGKCAYCESKITHIDYGHIEHFRPKSRPEFFEHAVEWNNLLLACGRCNGAEHKGVLYPDASEGGPLVDPTIEEPADHLKFDFDPSARIAAVLDRTTRGQTTWKTLGLNRPELIHVRSSFVKKLWVLASYYDSSAEARTIVNDATLAEAEYAAFAREVKKKVKAKVIAQI